MELGHHTESTSESISIQRQVCIICLDHVGLNDKYAPRRLYGACRCVYDIHNVCLDTWLAQHMSCPLCRTEIEVVVERGGPHCRDHDREPDVVDTLTMMDRLHHHALKTLSCMSGCAVLLYVCGVLAVARFVLLQ